MIICPLCLRVHTLKEVNGTNRALCEQLTKGLEESSVIGLTMV